MPSHRINAALKADGPQHPQARCRIEGPDLDVEGIRRRYSQRIRLWRDFNMSEVQMQHAVAQWKDDSSGCLYTPIYSVGMSKDFVLFFRESGATQGYFGSSWGGMNTEGTEATVPYLSRRRCGSQYGGSMCLGLRVPPDPLRLVATTNHRHTATIRSSLKLKLPGTTIHLRS